MNERFAIHPWKVIERSLSPEEMRFGESLTAMGNGYMGMRGNFEEDYTGDTHRGTYLGGVWFPDKTRVGWWKNGYPRYFGKAINALNMTGLHVRVNGALLDANRYPVRAFERELDLRRGVLTRRMTLELPEGLASIRSERFVSLAQKQLMALRYAVTCDFDARVEIAAFLDGNVRNEDSNYDETFWETLDGRAQDDGAFLLTRTRENPFGAPRFTVCAGMALSGSMARGERAAAGGVVQIFANENVSANQSAVLEKFVAVYTDRDHAPEALPGLACAAASQAAQAGFDAALRAQEAAWAARWETADVVVEGDDAAQQGIRFNLFQLLGTYTGEDARLNIGPKGFTGEKYGGATYWDTEAYCLPVYLCVAGDEVARNLLRYRHAQLPGAYHNARMQGLPGALFPMVTFTGVECHNEWEITFEELHRNSAVAYAIFHYETYTGDTTYAEREGLEVLAGIARFWAGRVHFSKRAGQYMIHGVTGPNEYENNVNNNWYTNRMAAWTLTYTAQVARRAGARRRAQLDLTDEELARFERIAANMYLPEDKTLGIFVQHDTFLDKELAPASAIPPAERPINQHWSWDKILRSCYIKQADVLQGLYFLSHLYDEETKRRNYLFYEPMTVHESSLSPCVHSILAAELGMREKAAEMYRRTARLDLDNINNDTADGLHITSMAGSYLSIAQGFARMRTADGALAFDPFLPEGWTRYAFRVRYRGRLLTVACGAQGASVTLERGEPLDLTLCGAPMRLSAGETRGAQG